MESPSAPTGREFVLWHRLLLIVSLLTFWSLPTIAEETIELVSAAEGSDVLLHVHNKPHDVFRIIWFREKDKDPNHFIMTVQPEVGTVKTGPEFSGRESLDKEGTLLIKNVKLKDTGYYVAGIVDSKKFLTMRLIHLFVYESVIFANIRAINSILEESEDTVILTCDSNAFSIHWFFNGLRLRLTERIKLSNDRRRLTIDPIKNEDSGVYHCEGSNPITSVKSWPVELRLKFE